jgi:plasmid maintenance system antidote protein VapI
MNTTCSSGQLLPAVALPEAQRPAQRSAVEPDGILWDDPPSAVDPPRFVGIVHSECDEHTLEDLAKRFAVSRSHECDIEKGRRGVSAERAARWARILGYAEALFVKLAMQAELDAAASS